MTTNAISTENLKQKLSSILHSGGGEKSTKITPLSLINENPYETTLQHNLVVTTNLNENANVFKVKLAMTDTDGSYNAVAVCYTENETVCDTIYISPGIYGEKYSQPSNINILGFGYVDASTSQIPFLIVDETSAEYINSYTNFAIYDKNNMDNFVKFNANNEQSNSKGFYILQGEGVNIGFLKIYTLNSSSAFSTYSSFQDDYLNKESEFILSPVNTINSDLLLSQNYSGETMWISSKSLFNTQPAVEIPLDDLNLEKEYWYCSKRALSENSLDVIVKFASDSNYTKLVIKVTEYLYKTIEDLVAMDFKSYCTWFSNFLKIYNYSNPNDTSEIDFVSCTSVDFADLAEGKIAYFTFNNPLHDYSYICSSKTMEAFEQDPNLGYANGTAYVFMLFGDFHFE